MKIKKRNPNEKISHVNYTKNKGDVNMKKKLVLKEEVLNELFVIVGIGVGLIFCYFLCLVF